jgi:single-stranded-DNA-specific exonuclease
VVIVVDHHQILENIPPAKIVVDPQQPGDQSEYKYLANVGLTFKLAEEILGQGLSNSLKNSFLELTALATISDMVPQIGENKMFIEEGLRSLANTFRPGLRAFLDILGEGEVVSNGFYKVISALNAAESVDFKNESYTLLTSFSKDTCMQLAQDLIAKTSYKQIKIKEITEEVERRITQKKDEAIIFEGDPAWRLVFAGPVASIIYAKYNKPTFIFKKGDSESSGSVRSPKGLDSVLAMKTCADFLITYGGHPQASGFRIKNENLEKFEKQLNEYFQKPIV